VTGRRVMWLGATLTVGNLLVWWLAAHEPLAAVAFGQGAALGMVLVFVAVVADRARRRPELEQAIEERDELAREVAKHQKWLLEAHQACKRLGERLHEEKERIAR
jgi:hypothetical protein